MIGHSVIASAATHPDASATIRVHGVRGHGGSPVGARATDSLHPCWQPLHPSCLLSGGFSARRPTPHAPTSLTPRARTQPSKSIISQFNLICGSAWKSQLANSGFFVGYLIGSGVFGG